MQLQEIDKLKRALKVAGVSGVDVPSVSSSFASACPRTTQNALKGKNCRLTYVRRLELIKNTSAHFCRVMALNDFHGMLLIAQPSFTALAPGFGIRKVNLVAEDARSAAGSFTSLHKEPVRDLAVHPVRHDQLLSASQDKTVKLSNVSSSQVLQRYECENEECWSVCWNADRNDEFFVGTKRGRIHVFDTKSTESGPAKQLEFPVNERRPIIALSYVPKNGTYRAFPCGGLLVLTLGSLWFFEDEDNEENTFKAHKLPVDGVFWSMRFEAETRLVFVSTKPTPHSKHLVCELSRVNVQTEASSAPPEFRVTCNVLFTHHRGGSYAERSFLRGGIFTNPVESDDEDGGQKVLLCYDRGSGPNDHKTVIAAIDGVDKPVQEITTGKAVLDMTPYSVNGLHFLALLCEYELLIYKWIPTS